MLHRAAPVPSLSNPSRCTGDSSRLHAASVAPPPIAAAGSSSGGGGGGSSSSSSGSTVPPIELVRLGDSRGSPHNPTTDLSSSSRKAGASSIRRRNRSGRPHFGPRLAAQTRQYAEILDAYEAGYAAWLHQEEEAYLQLASSGAPRTQLSQQAARHDAMMAIWHTKWGPPTNRDGRRLRILQQAGGAADRGAREQQQQQQQQQAHAVASPDEQQLVEQLVQQLSLQQHVDSKQEEGQQQHEAVAADQQQLEQPLLSGRQQHPLQPAATNAPPAAAGSARAKGSRQLRKRTTGSSSSPVFDIPEPTPELLAAAAAATVAAGRQQQVANATAGSGLILKALSQDPIDRTVLDSVELVFLHLALPRLVEWRLLHLLPVLASYILERPDRNEHSCGAVFNAYALANRLDLALATWDSLAAAGVDIGPYGSSALIKACARQNDLRTAKQVFEQLLRRRVTFNGYTYNCLLQLCGSVGSMEDALAVYNLQRLETDRANLPSAFTYNALLRAMLVSGRCELTQQIFENMLEDGVVPHPALYCNLLTAAGRAGNLGLARHLYQHMAVSLELPPPAAPTQMRGLIPLQQQQEEDGEDEDGEDGHEQQQQQQQAALEQQQQQQQQLSNLRTGAAILMGDDADAEGDDSEDDDAPNLLALVNALLFAHAQVGALHGALAIYRQELLGRGLVPDAYTATALLTAAARLPSGQLAWEQVVDIVALTHHFNIRLTTQLGTALINAYRRVRVWQPPQQQPAEQHAGGGMPAAAAAAAAGVSGSSGGLDEEQQLQHEAAHSYDDDAEANEEEDLQLAQLLPGAGQAQQHQHQQQQHPCSDPDAAWQARQLDALGVRPLVGVAPVVAASLLAARTVLDSLVAHKLATSNSWVTMLCFLLEAGQLGSFRALLAEMTQQHGMFPDAQGWDKLAYAADEAGAGAMLQRLQKQLAGMGASSSRPPPQGLGQQQQQQQRAAAV